MRLKKYVCFIKGIKLSRYSFCREISSWLSFQWQKIPITEKWWNSLDLVSLKTKTLHVDSSMEVWDQLGNPISMRIEMVQIAYRVFFWSVFWTSKNARKLRQNAEAIFYLWLRFNWSSLGSEVLCLLTKQDPGWKYEINWAIDVRWEASNCQQDWITCLSFSVQGNLTRAFVIFPFWISFLISSKFKPEPSKGSFPLKISNIRVPKANTSSVLRGCSGSCN